jgi:predicted metalloendopeptidase
MRSNKSELMLVAPPERSSQSAFRRGLATGLKDATKEIAVVDQGGGLGLPRRLLSPHGSQELEIWRQYLQHLTNILKLMGEPAIQSASGAKAAMQLETDLANISMGVFERRDPKSVYHIVSIDELDKEVTTLKMKQLLTLVGVPPVRDLNAFYDKASSDDTNKGHIGSIVAMNSLTALMMKAGSSTAKEIWRIGGARRTPNV